jgi:hypothetical protein
MKSKAKWLMADAVACSAGCVLATPIKNLAALRSDESTPACAAALGLM